MCCTVKVVSIVRPSPSWMVSIVLRPGACRGILQPRGAVAKTEPYENSVGFSDRSDVPVEPRLSEQWFLRYPKTKEALNVVRDHLIRFFPRIGRKFTRSGWRTFTIGASAGKCGGAIGFQRGIGKPKPQIPNPKTARRFTWRSLHRVTLKPGHRFGHTRYVVFLLALGL